MWGHYAGSHTGICLEFDARCAPFAAAEKVKYASTYPAFDVLKGGYEFLFTKSADWSYEAEWRLITEERAFAGSPRTIKTDNDVLTIPSSVLKSVTVGCLTDKSTRRQIEKAYYNALGAGAAARSSRWPTGQRCLRAAPWSVGEWTRWWRKPDSNSRSQWQADKALCVTGTLHRRKNGPEMISNRKPCNPSTTPSAQGCHPCLRYVSLPMSPVRTAGSVLEGEGFEHSVPYQKNNSFRDSSCPIRPVASCVPWERRLRDLLACRGNILEPWRPPVLRRSEFLIGESWCAGLILYFMSPPPGLTEAEKFLANRDRDKEQKPVHHNGLAPFLGRPQSSRSTQSTAWLSTARDLPSVRAATG